MTSETKWWLIGSGVGVVVGSFLPWVTAGIFSLPGTQGDGSITLILGGLIAVASLIGKVSKMTGWAVVVFAALTLLIIGNVFTNLTDDLISGDVFSASPGSGLFVAGAGALFAIGAGSKVLKEARAASAVMPRSDDAEGSS